jgi:hypothetical protein
MYGKIRGQSISKSWIGVKNMVKFEWRLLVYMCTRKILRLRETIGGIYIMSGTNMTCGLFFHSIYQDKTLFPIKVADMWKLEAAPESLRRLYR